MVGAIRGLVAATTGARRRLRCGSVRSCCPCCSVLLRAAHQASLDGEGVQPRHLAAALIRPMEPGALEEARSVPPSSAAARLICESASLFAERTGAASTGRRHLVEVLLRLGPNQLDPSLRRTLDEVD